MDTNIAAVKMRNITKRFGAVLANDRVWLNIYKGEILALLGENGSGKTTLMNMLSGIYFPDEGDIFINDEKVVIRSPKDAFGYGIGMIHQHFKLVDVLTAAENIILGLDGKLDLKAAAEKIRQICDTVSDSTALPGIPVFNLRKMAFQSRCQQLCRRLSVIVPVIQRIIVGQRYIHIRTVTDKLIIHPGAFADRMNHAGV